MANTILIKSRQTDATGPAATNLKVGELAVNTFDGRVYLGTDLSGASSRAAGGAATASTIVGAPVLDQDDLSSDSATSLATQQSIKAYVDGNAGTGDITGVTAGDGLSGGGNTGAVSLALDLNELTAATVAVGSDLIPIIDATDNSSKKESIADLMTGVAGTGIGASSGVLALDAAQTGITSLLATDIKIGEDDQTKIDFETADEIHFYAANAEQVFVSDGVFGPQTNSDVDLGTTGARFKDAYVDTVTTTGNLTIGGNIVVSGNLTADVEGDFTIDVEGNDVRLHDDGDLFGRIRHESSGGLSLRAEESDGDMQFIVNDGGSTTTAMRIYAATGGSVVVNKDLKIGQDFDNTVLSWGVNSDVSLTHVHDTGITLNSSRKLHFGDTGTYIHQSADGVLDLVSDSEIEINATTIDMNGAVDISGNLTVGGTTTTVNSTVVSIADPVFEIGASGTDDNLDRGLKMKYNSSGAKIAFIGLDDSTGKFTMIPDATDSSSTFSGTAGTLVMTTFEGALTGNVTGNASGSSGSCTGNAATATKLAATKTINGTAFDGSANIVLGNTSVTNGMLAGSIANAKLSNSTISGVSLGSNLNALTVDDSSISLDSGTTFNGSAARTMQIKASGVTNAMLAGSIANAKLANDGITIAGADTSLGGTITAATIAAAIDSEAMTLTNTTINGGAYST